MADRNCFYQYLSIYDGTMSKLYSFLFESKQNIMSLGFPEVIASIISQKFGKNDFLVARWLRDSESYHIGVLDKDNSFDKNWWRIANNSWFTPGKLNLVDLVDLYEAAKTLNLEEYNKMRKAKELGETDEVSEEDARDLKNQIEYELLKSYFFSYDPFMQDIQNGILTDLKPYKDLPYKEARDKYDKKRLFRQKENLVKEYPNGWRWINAGRKCELVGSLMKNCGSAGVMSSDPDRTILTLFDSRNKPHVVVTYSPNQKRISGDEGVGSSAVKEKYHDYVLDLAKHLGVRLDFEKTKSKILKLKAAFGDKIKHIERIDYKSTYDEYFKLELNDGSVYYTDSYFFAKEEDVKKLMTGTSVDDLVTAMKKAFDRYSNTSVGLYKFVDPIERD